MSYARRQHPSRFLVEPAYWRAKLTAMQSISPGLIIFTRPDLSNARCEVVEWLIRGHDGQRLRGLRCKCRFQDPQKAEIRLLDSSRALQTDQHGVEEGAVELIFQTLPARRLEDRVMDLLRIRQLAQDRLEIPASGIQFARTLGEPDDDFMIAEELIAAGLG